MSSLGLAGRRAYGSSSPGRSYYPIRQGTTIIQPAATRPFLRWRPFVALHAVGQENRRHHNHEQYRFLQQRGIAILIDRSAGGIQNATSTSRTTRRQHLDKLTATTCRIQRRTVVDWLPEVVQNFSIWGYSGSLLKTIHFSTGLPYWACFATISIGVRTALFPLVVYAAQTASRFAKIAPDVQFQVTLFQRDMKHYREMKAQLPQILFLMRTNLTTLASTYKLHKIHPFSVFLSPLCQIPILWYIAIDLRKIVNGLDPMLAQQLVDSPVAWIPDLTEADPYYGLPIMAGLLLYGNMEVAMGRRAMVGEVASKADISKLLKDIFQSFAVFMPCFTAHLPAGIQVYLVTSFCFTLVQSAALRTEACRQVLGLPSMLTQPLSTNQGRFSSQMMELKKLEQKARELRGDGPLLGKGVLMYGWELSFPGTNRKSTIQGSDPATLNHEVVEPVIPFVMQPYANVMGSESSSSSASSPNIPSFPPNGGTDLPSMKPQINYGPYVYGVSAPPWQLSRQRPLFEELFAPTMDELVGGSKDNREYLSQYGDDVMEKANRGEFPRPLAVVDEIRVPRIAKLDVNRLYKRKTKGKKSRRR